MMNEAPNIGGCDHHRDHSSPAGCCLLRLLLLHLLLRLLLRLLLLRLLLLLVFGTKLLLLTGGS